MKNLKLVLALVACALLAAGPAEAKKAKKPAGGGEQQEQQQGEGGGGGEPRYTPFPHNQTFVLKEINGKAPPVEMWLSIDSTGRANGFSGCKNWSGVFAVGGERLGPRQMPAINDHKCEPALAQAESAYWQVLMSGPFWETRGDELTLKAGKGPGVMKLQRSF